MVSTRYTCVIDSYSCFTGSIENTGEVPVCQTMSMYSQRHVPTFRGQIIDRDRRCIITQTPGIINGIGCWGAFEAAHIFPYHMLHTGVISSVLSRPVRPSSE